MTRRRFQGKDLREALEKVKEALGPEAVIFSTKRLESRERSGSEFIFEVEAAEWSDQLSAMIPPARLSGDEASSSGSSVSSAVAEEEAKAAEYYGEEVRKILLSELYESGMSEVIVRELLARAEEGGGFGEGDDALSAFRRRVAEILALLVDVGGTIRIRGQASERPIVASFVGPTGSGKSTVVAKLAAEFTFKKRKKVGMIALDSSGLGGTERLLVLARSMQLPCLLARSAEEFEAGLQRFRRADLILVDTAGRGPGEAEMTGEMKELFGPKSRIRNYLVLASNTNPYDMARFGDFFSCVPLNGLIFTKLDESSRFGVIFERHMDLGVPVAYFGSGRKISQGLEVATATRLAHFILPGALHHAVASNAAV